MTLIQFILPFLRPFWNFLKPGFILIAAAFFGYRQAKKNQKLKEQEEELESIKRLNRRRAKRDSDSDSVVTSRLRADARKE